VTSRHRRAAGRRHQHDGRHPFVRDSSEIVPLIPFRDVEHLRLLPVSGRRTGRPSTIFVSDDHRAFFTAATAAHDAVDETHDGLPEVCIDDAVEEEVEGEIHRLESVGNCLHEVIRLLIFTRIGDCDLAEKDQHLARNDKREKHHHDYEQR